MLCIKIAPNNAKNETEKLKFPQIKLKFYFILN